MSAWTLTASKGGDNGDYEKAPPGNHPAVLVALIDMGTQEQEFQGEVKTAHRVFFVWELTGEKKKDGTGHVIGIDLTLSLNEKAKLRQWVEARIGRPIGNDERYEITSELGQPCLLNVVLKNGYPKVAGVSAVPRGMTVPAPTYPLFSWHLDTASKTGKIELPGWVPWLYGKSLADHIKRAEELAGKEVAALISNGGPAAAPPPAAGGPPKPPPPRPSTPPKPEPKFWVALEDGKDPVLLPKNDAQQAIFAKGLDWDKVMVCREGAEAWETALDAGLKTAF